jgi:predicted O-linked N-acetylglucosamine transferase (SPINDLY family)
VNDHEQEVAETAPAREACGLPRDGFVFACFNANYKIDPGIFDVWVRILARVPGSVLWLLETSPASEQNLRREAASRGLDPARLAFAKPIAKPEHLARHRWAGLFLDTPLCNAHTTASDALWAGLPVLTCPGESFASRVAASLLAAVGLPELIVADLAAYEEQAVRLALCADELLRVRERLQANRRTTPLFDTPGFVRAIEAAYSRMWEIHCAGEAPRSFAVDHG